MRGTELGRISGVLFLLGLSACGSDGSSSDDPPPPAAPSNLAAPVRTSGRIELSWTDNSTDATGFSVERSPDGSLGWTEVGTTTAVLPSLIDLGLTPDTSYYYRVRAVGPGGWSAYSTVLPTATVKMAWQTPPDNPTGPTPLTGRYGHTAVYDAFNQQMVVYGGDDGSLQSQVWALSLADDDLTVQGANNWALLTDVAPPQGRYQHSAIYDPVRQRMVVFGGWTGAETNEIWTLTLPNVGTPAWSQINLPFGPSARVLHSAIYDEAHDRMVVFGGSSGAAVSSEVWALRFTGAGAPNWASLGSATIGMSLIGLSEHTAIYDPIGQRMLVFGGGDGSGNLNDKVYAATLPQAGSPVWSILTETTPTARSASRAVYDSAHRRMVVFGGYQGPSQTPVGEVWALPLTGAPAWTQVLPSNTSAPPRAYFSAVYDSFWERTVVFSGLDPENFALVDDSAWPLKF